MSVFLSLTIYLLIYNINTFIYVLFVLHMYKTGTYTYTLFAINTDIFTHTRCFLKKQ